MTFYQAIVYNTSWDAKSYIYCGLSLAVNSVIQFCLYSTYYPICDLNLQPQATVAYNRSSSCVIFSGFCILSRFVRVFGYKQNLVHVKWKEKAFCHLFFNENVISSLSICRIKLLEGTTKITHKISLYCTNLLCSSQSSKHFNRSNKTGTKIPIP